MRIIRPCTEDDYLLSFWTHQIRKGGWSDAMPPPEDRKKIILEKLWGKIPYDGQRTVTWHVCEIGTVTELEELHMPHKGSWLEDRRLWRDTTRLGDLANIAREIGFFGNPSNQDTGQWKNYHCWRHGELLGRLDCNEMPTLLDEGSQISIFDGWGRLLPYLVLVYEGKRFFPFEAYLARGSSGKS